MTWARSGILIAFSSSQGAWMKMSSASCGLDPRRGYDILTSIPNAPDRRCRDGCANPITNRSTAAATLDGLERRKRSTAARIISIVDSYDRLQQCVHTMHQGDRCAVMQFLYDVKAASTIRTYSHSSPRLSSQVPTGPALSNDITGRRHPGFACHDLGPNQGKVEHPEARRHGQVSGTRRLHLLLSLGQHRRDSRCSAAACWRCGSSSGRCVDIEFGAKLAGSADDGDQRMRTRPCVLERRRSSIAMGQPRVAHRFGRWKEHRSNAAGQHASQRVVGLSTPCPIDDGLRSSVDGRDHLDLAVAHELQGCREAGRLGTDGRSAAHPWLAGPCHFLRTLSSGSAGPAGPSPMTPGSGAFTIGGFAAGVGVAIMVVAIVTRRRRKKAEPCERLDIDDELGLNAGVSYHSVEAANMSASRCWKGVYRQAVLLVSILGSNSNQRHLRAPRQLQRGRSEELSN